EPESLPECSSSRNRRCNTDAVFPRLCAGARQRTPTMLRGACIGKLVDGEKRRHCTSALECGSAFTQGVVEHGGFRGARVRGAPDLVSGKHLRGLRALKQEQLHRRYLAVSLDPIRRKTED